MSDQSRLQVREYMEAIYEDFLSEISASRGISNRELRRIANEMLLRTPEDAVKYKMADAVGYRDEAIKSIKERIGLKEEDKLKMVTLASYSKSRNESVNYRIKDKIAVVFAEGIINIGKGVTGQVTDDKYAEIIQQLRKRDDIKAIVLRVNSPGGSALASDNIWREIELAKEAGKVVVASMGDVAASGGYYISCNADSILAESNTITGSIGVVAAIPSFQKLANEKIGIHVDTVKTGKFSAGIHPFLDISEEEQKILNESIEEMYQTFLKRVAKGRNMPVEKVHEIAQGRVWAGDKAMELGLVDAMGGLEEAIATAARMADLEEYRISEYPKLKEPLQQLIEDITGQKTILTEKLLQQELGGLYQQYQYLKMINNMSGAQAIMPFQLHFD